MRAASFHAYSHDHLKSRPVLSHPPYKLAKAGKLQPKPEIAMFKSVKNLFACSSSSKRTATKTRLHVESLENRKLMTAGIALGTDGVIRVEGSDD
jgi:hypothetical protein